MQRGKALPGSWGRAPSWFFSALLKEAEGRSEATGAATAPVALVPTESPAGRPPKGVIGGKGVQAACGLSRLPAGAPGGLQTLTRSGKVLGEHFGTPKPYNGHMKFGLSIEKKNATNIGQVRGHNHREHATRSQLPERAWFNEKASNTLVEWREELLDQAKGLAKRKDAVLAIELSIQVGNQTDWREAPDEACPEGRPKSGKSAKMNALIVGVREAIKAEIGADRVVSAVLHMDESTPHIQLVFVPVIDGKLNAKHWVGGAVKCAQLREGIHRHVNAKLPCEYMKGAPGGAPHDSMKAAGKTDAPGGLVASMKSKIQQLEQKVQTLFSQLKSEQKKVRLLKVESDDLAEKAMKKIQVLEAELRQLKPPVPPPLKSQPTEPVDALARPVEVSKRPPALRL